MSPSNFPQKKFHYEIHRAKRSWFANFRSEREKEEVVVVYRDKGFQDLKTELRQALNVSRCTLSLFHCASEHNSLCLQVVNCQFEELNENNFKVKYESSKQKGFAFIAPLILLSQVVNGT